MQLYATMKLIQLMQLYENILQIYATISYATICKYMQLYCNNFLCNYIMQTIYATMQHAPICNMQLCNYMRLMQLYATI
jgi:hypothetical protein